MLKVPITYAWTNGRTDKQTRKDHKDGTDQTDRPEKKPDWLGISTDGNQEQTDELDGPTNGRTDQTDGKPDKQTDELERRTVRTAKQTGWTDG